jgi:S-adenosyl-L-methionine hydrolase (adenosine-forming)
MAAPASLPPGRNLLTFLTDFGTADTYVGAVKGAMLGVHSNLAIVDLTHEIPPQDVLQGALQLMSAAQHFPSGTVHLAVVDPGVGTDRRGIVVSVGGHTFVGPDNGLLSFAVSRIGTQCGITIPEQGDALLLPEGVNAVVLDEPRFWRQPVAPTFHGRDIFGPVAAHVARGVPMAVLGTRTDRMLKLPFPRPVRHTRHSWSVEIVQVDRYGNLTTCLPGEMARGQLRIIAGQVSITGLQQTYGSTEGPVALIGSAGFLEIAVPGGSAAAELGLQRGDSVQIEME